eukprot:CAMPEP_0194289348 /NCGR_PEP_ID=MMETSP0169-20130528/38903_1 /TAXON_ID=218684 /ORGANISM="Corethron pennatum, Strain L29A3" /LENGTH=611 /DNA_ID=CAMNT_0039036605 /DNA_START=271 /DNA_END=2106 /DNA_ORIENTATION=-
MAIFGSKKNKAGKELSSFNKASDSPIIFSSDSGKKKYLIRNNNGKQSGSKSTTEANKKETNSCSAATKTKSIIAINAQLALYHDLKRKISVLEGIFMNTYGPAILTKSEIGFREMLILRAKLRNQLSKYRDKFFADNGRVPQTDKDLSPIKDVVSEYLQLREIIRTNAATKIQAIVRAQRARQTANGRHIFSMVKERKRKEIMAGMPKSPNTRQMPRSQPNYHFSRNTNRMQTIIEEDDNSMSMNEDDDSLEVEDEDGVEWEDDPVISSGDNPIDENDSNKLQTDFKLQKVESGNITEMLSLLKSGRQPLDAACHENRDDEISVSSSSQNFLSPATMEVMKDLMHSDQMNILQGAYNKRINDDDVSIHSMNRDDMTEEELKTIKFKLKLELKKFDTEFISKNGRKPTRSERQPTFHLFLAYIKVKSRLKALSVQRDSDDCRTVASDCSSVLTMEADISSNSSSINMQRNGQQERIESAVAPLRPPAYPKVGSKKMQSAENKAPVREKRQEEKKVMNISPPESQELRSNEITEEAEGERPTFEVKTTVELLAQKNEMNRRLKRYDLDFVQANGRKPTWSESKPIHKTYQDYVRVKAQLDMRMRAQRSLMDDD